MQYLYENVIKLDKKCYEIYQLPEDILMEHAATALVQHIKRRFSPGSSVLVVAGPGNNGGDGLAAARQLLGEYEVCVMMPYGAKSQMCQIQYDRYEACEGEFCDDIKESDVVVDALFGSGLAKPLREEAIKLLLRLNELESYKIACDIPSGIDNKGNPLPVAFKADATITMGALKRALFMDRAKDYVGEVEVADLGVSRNLYEERSPWMVLEERDLRPPYRESQDCNKGTFGHLAVIAGQKEGAGIMAALAALRFGAGLVSVVTFEKIQLPPMLMHSSSLPPKTTAIAVGMGLGLEYSDEDFQRLVLQNDLPIVVDADLFYSEKILEILQKRRVVLTPHPKEFASLLHLTKIADVDVDEVQSDRAQWVERFCQKYPDVVLLLKGANPIIACKESYYVNPLGSSALAKGGSGDVLTGLIGALLAQGYEPLQAALQASLAHTIAAKRVDVANYALTPMDLIEAVGRL